MTDETVSDGPPDYSGEHVELEAVDEPGPPETAPHPLEVDDDEAARGQAVYEEIDDLDDDSTGGDVAGDAL